MRPVGALLAALAEEVLNLVAAVGEGGGLFGSSDPLSWTGRCTATTKALAHSPQNLSPRSLAAPQVGQSISDESDDAHWEQNFRPSRLSVPQLWHCIESLPRRGRSVARGLV